MKICRTFYTTVKNAQYSEKTGYRCKKRSENIFTWQFIELILCSRNYKSSWKVLLFYFNKMDVSLKNITRLQNFTKPTKHKEDFNFTHKNFFIKSSKKLVPKAQIQRSKRKVPYCQLLTGFGQPIFGEGKGNLEPGLARLHFRHWLLLVCKRKLI